MPIFKFGSIIKSRREEMGYTQEDLADGICSVPTLSRIENGERMPSKEHFEMLLQRLGYSNTALDAYVDAKEFHKHELKFQLRQAVILKQMGRARELLDGYKQIVINPTPIDKQFMILYQVLTGSEKYPQPERTTAFEEALRLTCPRYEQNHFPKVLSYEEIILINNIAISSFQANKKEEAVELLYGLKNYYENRVSDPEEALRTQPMVLYNLSKYLGLMEKYNESIEISRLGIRLCTETGRCAALPGLMFNLSWSQLKRGHANDLNSAKQWAKKAYYLAAIMWTAELAQPYQRFFADEFGEEISL